MDIVTLGAALNGSAEYVNSHFKGGSNIQIVDNPDGTQTINASGEVSSEDTVARAEIAAIKDGGTLDSFGDVETALGDKADTSTTYTKTEVDTALSVKANSADVYSKTAVDTALSNKADKSTTYTKTEVDTSLDNKADKSTTYTKTEVDTALGGKVDKETGKGLSTNDYTTAEKTKLAGIAEGAEVNVQSNWTQTTTTADDYIKNKPTLGTAAAKNATDTYNATGTDVTTGKAVAAALATLPEPMVFKGSLGTGGTITTLPTASSSNKGYVYKVITAGTYASQSAKVGDTFISDGSAWVLIPSGDEPSGTVTNVAVANGGGLAVSGSPITSSGTITVGHSNSVTAKTSSSLKKFTYDAYGHVTGSSELSTAESDALASGIDSTKVAQIETNKNNISLIKQVPTVESGDNGKVLTAGTNGEYSWVTPSGGGGTSDYTQLANLPQINSTTLTGNKSLSDLGIAAAADIPSVPITEIQKNSTTISPVFGVVNITVPTTAADVSALPASTKYAGASTAGGSATSAVKLDTTSAGSTTQPVYFSNGVPTATSYSLAKSVPSNAVFTDTTYESKSAASGGTAVSLCTTGEKYTWNNKQSALTTTQLDAVNSGINSTKVAQIATNEANISINSIKSSITMEQGYTLVAQSTLYQQGKHIFGNLIIKKDSGNFSDTSETVCTLGKSPAITGMLFCGFGASEWGIESIGYAFLGSNGGVSVKDTKTTNTTVNIAVDYVIS